MDGARLVRAISSSGSRIGVCEVPLDGVRVAHVDRGLNRIAGQPGVDADTVRRDLCAGDRNGGFDGFATARMWIPDAVAATLQPASTVAVTPKDAVEVAANVRVGIKAGIEINKPNANEANFIDAPPPPATERPSNYSLSAISGGT